MGVIIGELAIQLQFIPGCELFNKRTLRKEVLISLTFSALPHILDDSTGQSAVGVIVIDFCLPVSVLYYAIYAGFGTERFNIAVPTGGGGIIGYSSVKVVPPIAEFILSVRFQELAAQTDIEAVVYLLLQTERGIDQLNGSGLIAYQQVCFLIPFKARFTSF